jgi:hypothetical protein
MTRAAAGGEEVQARLALKRSIHTIGAHGLNRKARGCLVVSVVQSWSQDPPVQPQSPAERKC